MTPTELRRRWREGEEVALFDAREEEAFAEGHPFFAVCLPPSQVEARAADLVPRRSAPLVIFDNGEGAAARVADRLRGLGYNDVSCLEGDLDAYARDGELFRDVNVPSKAFGELVESTCHTPSLAAPDVKRLIDAGANVQVLDVRRFEEYRTMSIPTAVSVPNAELALRVFDLVPSPDTLVVVNCAGRTRSIIGTQTLVNIGLPNRVAALRNGTIGWTLEGYRLDTGQTRTFASNPDASRRRAAAAARHWANQVGVRVIDRPTYDQWMAERDRRTLYRLDVRTPAEHAAGHPAGFLPSPGGQLVQATDEWVAVRGARLVLFDDLEVRALMTAAWLVQMGWDAVAIQPEAIAADQTGMAVPLASPGANRYRRPYEGTDNPREKMQAYIDWELQLVQQIEADGVSRFRVVCPDAGSSCATPTRHQLR